jgi:hypothetical protein
MTDTTKPKRAKRPRPPIPASAWKLAKASLRELRAGWKRYLAIMAIVTVPLNILGLSTAFGSNAVVNAYAYVAIIIMNVALLWAVIEHDRTGDIPGPGAAYYDGSAILVRFMVTTVLIVPMFIPALLGLGLSVLGTSAPLYGGTAAEEYIIMGIGVLISLLSAWMLVRFALAPTIASAANLRPLASLRYARRLTLGRFWRVFSRLCGLLLLIIVLGIPIAIVTALLGFIRLGLIATLFAELATTFVAFPIFNIYLLRLYHDLENKPAPEPESAAELKVELQSQE